MEHWWKQTIGGENRSTRTNACPNSTFATASHKWMGLSAFTDRQI